MRHAYTRATAMPPDLVEAQARANSACEKVWREARRNSDFALVRPHLEEVVRLMRQAARRWRRPRSDPLRRADGRLPAGHARRDVTAGVRRYEAFLRRALPQAEERQARRPPPLRPAGPFPIAVQEALCRRLSERLGLDFAQRGWTVRRIRSPAARRPMCASPRATTRPTSPRRCSQWCTRPAMRCTSAACRGPGRASRSARRPAWRRTKASR